MSDTSPSLGQSILIVPIIFELLLFPLLAFLFKGGQRMLPGLLMRMLIGLIQPAMKEKPCLVLLPSRWCDKDGRRELRVETLKGSLV